MSETRNKVYDYHRVWWWYEVKPGEQYEYAGKM
jgi:hypothetical protein